MVFCGYAFVDFHPCWRRLFPLYFSFSSCLYVDWGGNIIGHCSSSFACAGVWDVKGSSGEVEVPVLFFVSFDSHCFFRLVRGGLTRISFLIIRLSLEGRARRVLYLFRALCITSTGMTLIILFLRNAVLSVNDNVDGCPKRRLTTVRQAIRVTRGLRLRNALLRRSLLAARQLTRSTRACRVRRLVHLPEGQARAISRPLTRFDRLLFALRVIRFAVRRRSLKAAQRVNVQRVNLRVALRNAIVRRIVAHRLFSFVRLLLVRIIRLLILRLNSDLKRGLLVDLVARVFRRSALFEARRVTYAAGVRILRDRVRATARITRDFRYFRATAKFQDRAYLNQDCRVTRDLLITAPCPASRLVRITRSRSINVVRSSNVNVKGVSSILCSNDEGRRVVIMVSRSRSSLLRFLQLRLSVPSNCTTI